MQKPFKVASYKEILLMQVNRINELSVGIISKRERLPDDEGWDTEKGKATAQTFVIAIKALESIMSPFLSKDYLVNAEPFRKKLFNPITMNKMGSTQQIKSYGWQSGTPEQFQYIMSCMDLYALLVGELGSLGVFQEEIGDYDEKIIPEETAKND